MQSLQTNLLLVSMQEAEGELEASLQSARRWRRKILRGRWKRVCRPSSVSVKVFLAAAASQHLFLSSLPSPPPAPPAPIPFFQACSCVIKQLDGPVAAEGQCWP